MCLSISIVRKTQILQSTKQNSTKRCSINPGLTVFTGEVAPRDIPRFEATVTSPIMADPHLDAIQSLGLSTSCNTRDTRQLREPISISFEPTARKN